MGVLVEDKVGGIYVVVDGLLCVVMLLIVFYFGFVIDM